LVFTSHPSAGLSLQSAKPAPHAAMTQRPPTHAGVALLSVHMREQAPHDDTVVLVFTSHPSAGLPLQSAKPVLHAAMVQRPTVQAAVALASAHTRPQPPHAAAVLLVFTSHPSAGLPLQSAKPALHAAIAQRPPAQRGEALVRSHTVPQAPQLRASVPRSVSQPLPALPSQLPRPAAHIARPHIESVHAAVPPMVTHTLPQRPQLRASERVLTSQPFEGSMSQSAKPALQVVMVQRPMVQTPVACEGSQTRPQAPQLRASLRMSASQPLASVPSQS
jgi:hypothetical protein